jgi:polyketide biosynthesis acyl carrier protein
MDDAQVFGVVRRKTLDVLPELDPAAVTTDGTLTDLGANSLDRMDIVTLSMEELGIAVPVTEFRAVHDIGSLVALLQRYT